MKYFLLGLSSLLLMGLLIGCSKDNIDQKRVSASFSKDSHIKPSSDDSYFDQLSYFFSLSKEQQQRLNTLDLEENSTTLNSWGEVTKQRKNLLTLNNEKLESIVGDRIYRESKTFNRLYKNELSTYNLNRALQLSEEQLTKIEETIDVFNKKIKILSSKGNQLYLEKAKVHQEKVKIISSFLNEEQLNVFNQIRSSIFYLQNNVDLNILSFEGKAFYKDAELYRKKAIASYFELTEDKSSALASLHKSIINVVGKTKEDIQLERKKINKNYEGDLKELIGIKKYKAITQLNRLLKNPLSTINLNNIFQFKEKELDEIEQVNTLYQKRIKGLNKLSETYKSDLASVKQEKEKALLKVVDLSSTETERYNIERAVAPNNIPFEGKIFYEDPLAIYYVDLSDYFQLTDDQLEKLLSLKEKVIKYKGRTVDEIKEDEKRARQLYEEQVKEILGEKIYKIKNTFNGLRTNILSTFNLLRALELTSNQIEVISKKNELFIEKIKEIPNDKSKKMKVAQILQEREKEILQALKLSSNQLERYEIEKAAAHPNYRLQPFIGRNTY